MHPCCTTVSWMILKTNSDYSYTDNKLSLDRNSQHPCEMWEQTIVSILYTHSQFIYCQGNDTFLHIILFSFQLAKGGTESAVYNKLIAPFKNDMPNSYVEGFGKVCADHKYAFFGVNILKTKVSLPVPCQVVSLHGTSYKDQWAFIFRKDSPYKTLINWRLDNKMYSFRHMTDN